MHINNYQLHTVPTTLHITSECCTDDQFGPFERVPSHVPNPNGKTAARKQGGGSAKKTETTAYNDSQILHGGVVIDR